MITGPFQFIRPNRDYREFLILSKIWEEPRASQRTLGRWANITAAMVNHYILELVANNYIQVEGTTNRSMSYHLTPAGVLRRTALRRMMFAELSSVFGQIKSVYRNLLGPWVEQGKRRAAVVGEGEKAQLAEIAAREAGMQVVRVAPGAELESSAPEIILDCRAEPLPPLGYGVPVERF